MSNLEVSFVTAICVLLIIMMIGGFIEDDAEAVQKSINVKDARTGMCFTVAYGESGVESVSSVECSGPFEYVIVK